MSAYRNVSAGLDLSGGDRTVDDAALSPASDAAYRTAVRIAAQDGAHLHLVAAVDLDAFAAVWARREETAGRPTARTLAETRLVALARNARADGVRTTSVAAPLGSPGQVLLDDAESAGRDLVVVGTRERGEAARNLLGSTSLSLVRRARRAVWIARTPFTGDAKRIVCAIDLGNLAERIVGEAARLAESCGASLHVLHVVHLRAADLIRPGAADAAFLTEYVKERRARAEREIPAIVAAAGRGLPAQVEYLEGDVNDVLPERAAALGADLLVVGSVVHGVGGAALGLGRTAERVLATATSSVLVLKP